MPEAALLLREPGLQVIRLSGSPAAMGQAHGRLLGSQMHRLRREFLLYLGQLSLGIGALPLYLLICILAWRFRPLIPPSFWEEMQAVAQGAAIHVSFILFINVMDDLLNNIPRCSTFAARLQASAPTTFILARNLDHPLFAKTMCRYNTVLVFLPTDGQPFVSIGWPGYIGVCTGMNRSQVALGQLTAATSDVSLAGVPAALRNRLALQYHHTVLEAAARIASLPGTLGANLILASPRETLLLELSAHHRQVRLPQDGILTATNHYQSPGMEPWQGAAFRRPLLSPLDNYHFSTDYSLARNQRLQHLLSAQTLNIPRAQQILGDPLIANPCDVNSVIFDTAASTVYLAQGLELPVSRRGRFRRLSHLFDPEPQVA